MNCMGVILAGGLARRMGGIDKPLIEIGGKPILAHLIERLGPQCAMLTLNANDNLGRFAGFPIPAFSDCISGFAGPLAGILSAMEFARMYAPDATDVLSVPGDTPFVPVDLAQRLYDARTAAGALIAVAASGGRVHHAVALWPVELRDDLRRALVEEGERKVSAFIGRYPNVTVEWPIEPRDPFFNVNSPEDLAGV